MLILGVGGLGSWASYALLCCGVGELVLVDGDHVEESNFNRQILYRERDIGRPKAEAAAEALAEFDSSCRLTAVARRLESVDAVREVVEGVDFVVNGADWPAHDIERWVNAACFDAGVPFITMSHSPPVARVGPLYVPGTTGCFACQERTYRDAFPLYDELVDQRRGRPSEAATLGPVCAFIGGPGGARDAPPRHRPVPARVARHGLRLRPADDGGDPRAGAARRGLRGLRLARDQSRAALVPHALAGARLGPEARDVVACEAKSRHAARFAPSFRPRTNVCSFANR